MPENESHPGFAFVRNGWRFIIKAREIRRGRYKGQWIVTLPKYNGEFMGKYTPGKKVRIKRSSIKEFPNMEGYKNG
jgi:hypothetical protein